MVKRLNPGAGNFLVSTLKKTQELDEKRKQGPDGPMLLFWAMRKE